MYPDPAFLRQSCDAVLRPAKTSHLEVRIETVADPTTLKQKTDAFQRETRPNGVRQCLGKEPSSVQVFVADKLQKQGLSATTGKALRPLDMIDSTG